jgi:hypothetical protein
MGIEKLHTPKHPVEFPHWPFNDGIKVPEGRGGVTVELEEEVVVEDEDGVEVGVEV